MTVRLHLAISLIAIGVVSLACASHSQSRPGNGPVDRYGRYAFTERPSGTSLSFEGSFIVVADTVIMEANPGPCRYETNSSRGGPIVYHCADVNVAFDRDDPVHKARYTYTFVEQRPKSVCLRYNTTPSGQRVCAQTGIEMVEVKTPKTGLLRPQRVDASATTP